MWPSRRQYRKYILIFLLTHPVWDVTFNTSNVKTKRNISTHTSRVGCDTLQFHSESEYYHFYSHIPCGMWLSSTVHCSFILSFLLTHPVWDVTTSLHFSTLPLSFLLTHPVWDVTLWTLIYFINNFISTHTSRVGCDHFVRCITQNILISTHTSRVGCDFKPYSCLSTGEISTHTSRVGCDVPLYCQ